MSEFSELAHTIMAPENRLPTTELIVCEDCGADGERNLVSGRLTVGWLRLTRQVAADEVTLRFYCSLDCLDAAISMGDLG